MLSSNLTVVTSSSSGQVSRAAMRLWDTVIYLYCVGEKWTSLMCLCRCFDFIVFGVITQTWQSSAYSLRRNWSNVFLAHTIGQKMCSIILIFKVVFFPKWLNFVEHARGRSLGLQLWLNWSIFFSRTFFDDEIVSFSHLSLYIDICVCVCMCVCLFESICVNACLCTCVFL